MNSAAETLNLLSISTGLARDRVTTTFDAFYERDGGDSRGAARATEWIVRTYAGDPLRIARELRRQTRQPDLDGTQLRVHLPACRQSFQARDGSTDTVQWWAPVDTSLPVLLNHDSLNRRIGVVTGWREKLGDLDIWLTLGEDQADLQVKALWSELSASPRYLSRGDEWTHRDGADHAMVSTATIKELSLTPVHENRIPGVTVTCEACPADARHQPAPQARNTTGNYEYRDRRTGEMMHVRTWGIRATVT